MGSIPIVSTIEAPGSSSAGGFSVFGRRTAHSGRTDRSRLAGDLRSSDCRRAKKALDDSFGSGRSADILVSSEALNCLVEVKSAGGMPSEGLIADLDRYRRTWSALGRAEELDRSALVVNHQHVLPPLARAAQPYERAEFLALLQHAVVPALALFAWWRDAQHDEIADAFIRGPAEGRPNPT